jgi:nicotinamidase-related amidase
MEQNTNTALLVMDMQTGILATFPEAAPVVGTIAKAIAAARNHNIPVIYVTLGFRPGAPEISSDNKSFVGWKDTFGKVNIEEFMKVVPELTPLPADIVVTKRRISAFTGSDLEVVLRAQNIRHLVLTGIVTSGIVLSTVREAADKDYRLTVLSDGCADRDEEVHRVLTTKVFPRQADVMTVEEWSGV